MREHRLRDGHEAHDVRLEDAADRVERHLGRTGRTDDPGVVHDGVDPARARDDRAHGQRDRLGVVHVEREGFNPFGRELGQALRAASGGERAVPPCLELADDGASNPGGATRDEDNLLTVRGHGGRGYQACGKLHPLLRAPRGRAMPSAPFTRNYRDHSNNEGFQFEFFCDKCGSGIPVLVRREHAGPRLRPAQGRRFALRRRRRQRRVGRRPRERRVPRQGVGRRVRRRHRRVQAPLPPVWPLRALGLPGGVLESDPGALPRVRARPAAGGRRRPGPGRGRPGARQGAPDQSDGRDEHGRRADGRVPALQRARQRRRQVLRGLRAALATPTACAKCNAPMSPTARFCASCGSPRG